jgi:hypothetical protein
MNAALVSIALVSASASVVGALAYVCSKRQSILLFAVSVTLAWVLVALATGHFTQIASRAPQRIPEWRRIVDSFISMAPLVLFSASFAAVAVAGRVTARRIPLLAFSGALLGLPLAFLVAVASSCYIAFECL